MLDRISLRSAYTLVGLVLRLGLVVITMGVVWGVERDVEIYFEVFLM